VVFDVCLVIFDVFDQVKLLMGSQRQRGRSHLVTDKHTKLLLAATLFFKETEIADGSSVPMCY